MPWKETCRMDEKLVFVADCLRGELPMAALCEDYGISRKTGYKWLGRYREQGPEGLVERSRAPHRHGRSMAPELAEAIVALRRQRPHWGPRKLRAVLMGERPEAVWPAASTMGDLLRAEGLVSSRRRRRRRVAAPGRPFRAVTAPNDVWCIDFKGWFRTRDGERCDPLTVSDAYSRFLLACVIVPPRTDTVRVAVEQLFKRYGRLWPSARTTGHRSPERARADCLVCRSAGSRPASRWSASSRASPSRTDGTSACIGP